MNPSPEILLHEHIASNMSIYVGILNTLILHPILFSPAGLFYKHQINFLNTVFGCALIQTSQHFTTNMYN